LKNPILNSTKLPTPEKIAREIIHGNMLLLPQALVDILPERSRKRSGQDTTALVYEFIVRRYVTYKQLAKSKGRKPRFCPIMFERFLEVNPTKQTIQKSKQFLEDQGFLKIDHSYSQGNRPKRYLPLRRSGLVPYEIKDSRYKLVEEFTQQEANSIATRNNLNRLQFDEGRFYEMLDQRIRCRLATGKGEDGSYNEKINEFYGIQSTLYPVVNLVNRKGRVFRDRTGRLHSPFTNLHKGYRCCFTVDGFPLTGIDMVAAQPTLLGLVSEDEQLVDDCFHGNFYEQIAELCGTDRETAKENYCWFAYGAIKTKQTALNAEVCEIQRWFQGRYPRAYQQILEDKRWNYRRFSHKMMKLESDIFVDGVFREFTKANEFCLTVHDGIYFKNTSDNAKKAETLLRQKLSNRFQTKMVEKIAIKIENLEEKYTKTLIKDKNIARKKQGTSDVMFLDSRSVYAPNCVGKEALPRIISS
jgi:hypothetical protein